MCRLFRQEDRWRLPSSKRICFRWSPDAGSWKPRIFRASSPSSRRTGHVLPVEETTFFLSRITFLATPKPGMAIWREKLFVVLSRNTQRASSYFHLPAEQVVEIGLVLEI